MEEKLKQIASLLGDAGWKVKITAEGRQMGPSSETTVHFAFDSVDTGSDKPTIHHEFDISGVAAANISKPK